MVEAVRSGQTQHEVAREFHVSPATVNRWVHHAHGRRLDRVDWSDRSRAPHTTQRTTAALEDLSWTDDARCETRAIWASPGPKRSATSSIPGGSSHSPRCGRSTPSSTAVACWTVKSGSDV